MELIVESAGTEVRVLHYKLKEAYLQTGSPLWFRRQSVVVEPLQLLQINPCLQTFQYFTRFKYKPSLGHLLQNLNKHTVR